MKHQRRQSVAEKRARRNVSLAADLPAISGRDHVQVTVPSEGFLRTAILVFLVAAAVRLLHVWQIRHAPFFSMLMGDARGYDDWARRLAGGQWLAGEVFYQAPLYPYFLGTIYSIAGPDLLVVRIVQALLGGAACALLALAAARLFSRSAGLVAGLALALYAPAIFFDGVIQKSVLDVFFVCLALWLMSRIITGDAGGQLGSGSNQTVRPVSASRTWQWLFLGLAMGALALTRENAMVLVAVLLVWAWLQPGHGAWYRPRAHTIYSTAAFVLGLALLLVPVAVRNYAVGGGFYLTTSQFGSNFFIGNNPKSDGTYMSLRYGRGAPEYERQDATELAEQALGRPLTPSEVSGFWTDRAMGFITSQPGAWLRLVGRKVLLLWNADEMLDTESQETYAEWSLPLRIGSWFGHFGVLVPLAVFGMWAAWPDRRRLWVFYAMTLAYAASVIIFYVFARYRFPLVPFLILFAAVGLMTAIDLFAGWRAPAAKASGLPQDKSGRRLWESDPSTSERMPAAMPSTSTRDMSRRKHSESDPSTSEKAPAAMPSAPARGISVRTRRGWGPGAGGKKLIPVGTAVVVAAAVTNWPLLSTSLMQAITENNLAVAFQEDGRLDEAIAHYRRSIAFRPEYAPAYNNMGAALRANGQIDEAVASYERALRAQPDYPDAHYNLANALLDKNKPGEAAVHFRIALHSMPASAGARNNLAIALADDGQLEEAVAEFRAALQVEPGSAKTNRNLGKALSEMGRAAEGIGYLRRAVELDPNDRDAHYDLGSDLLEMGQPGEAAKEFEAAVTLAPDWAAAHNNLGIALASQGRLDEAITHFQQALTIQPGFEDATRNLAIARAQKKGVGR